jgi:hypothetical protein
VQSQPGFRPQLYGFKFGSLQVRRI